MKFRLLGQDVAISEAAESYNTYRKLFIGQAKTAANQFFDTYERNQSLEDVVRKTPDQIAACIAPSVELCIQILVDHGVYNIDREQFSSTYRSYLDRWKKAYEAICDQYDSIVSEQEELDQYRVARRENRGRWVGGGFGVGGALKGAATAGAMNMVSGAAHRVVNGVGKIFSSLSASSEMRKIFNDSKTRSSLARSVWNTVFYLHYALIDCLDRTGADHLPYEGRETSGMDQKATAILNNIGHIADASQRREALLEAFRIDPYLSDWYLLALQSDGDPDGKLQEAADYFDIPGITSAKQSILDTFAKALPLDTEDAAKLAVQKIQAEKERLQYFEDTEHTQLAVDAVKNFDIAYRTVDGYLHHTREDADFSRSEINQILAVEEGVDFSDIDSVAGGQQQLSVFHSAVAQQHQQKLDEAWTGLDIKRRSVATGIPNGEPLVFDTPEFAAQAQQIADQLRQRMITCQKSANAEAALKTMLDHLAYEGLPAELLACYTAELNRLLRETDQKERTAMGQEYPTREAAANARQTYTQLEQSVHKPDAPKHAEAIRKQIAQADLPEATKEALRTTLFQKEHATRIAAAKGFGKASTWILIAVIIVSHFLSLSCTQAFLGRRFYILGYSYMLSDLNICDRLSFWDGIKNAVVVFGHCAGDIFIKSFHEYFAGFHNGFLAGVVWAVVGIFWTLIKHVFLAIPRYILCLVTVFFQKASIFYYVGYALGTWPLFRVLSAYSNKGEEEENIRRQVEGNS